MTAYITHIRLSPPNVRDHEHITHVQWTESGATYTNTRQEMVNRIDGGKVVYVKGTPDARVGVVKVTPPYLRTYADGDWTNNLLSLPTF